MKALYLYKYHNALKDPLPPERKKRFDIGHQVGVHARQLFPGGTLASSKHANAYRADLKITQQLISEGCPVLYEAAFMHNGVIVYCDILIKNGEKWKLAEVKSSNYISETYKEDLALQFYIVSNTGIGLASACLITLKSTVSATDFSLSPLALFEEADLTAYCSHSLERIDKEITKMKWMLSASTAPDVSMGEHCQTPYPCEFIGYCSSANKEIREGLFSSGIN